MPKPFSGPGAGGREKYFPYLFFPAFLLNARVPKPFSGPGAGVSRLVSIFDDDDDDDDYDDDDDDDDDVASEGHWQLRRRQ